jgi:hypothetical protein
MTQTVNIKRLSDGSGATVSFKAVAIPAIKTIAISVLGTKEKIDLTTLANTSVTTSVLSTISEIEDVVLGCGFVPNQTFASGSEAMIVTVPTYDGLTITLTLFCEFGGASTSDVAARAGSDVDYTFVVTNLNTSGVETIPVVAVVGS